jgi:hypothetical protein
MSRGATSDLAPSARERRANEDINSMTNTPPSGLPRYRILTGPDDENFCRRVSEALDLGFRLHGSPAVTYNGERVVVAQAVIWADKPPSSGTPEAQD